MGGSGAALGGSGGAPGGPGRALGGSIYTKTPDQPPQRTLCYIYIYMRFFLHTQLTLSFSCLGPSRRPTYTFYNHASGCRSGSGSMCRAEAEPTAAARPCGSSCRCRLRSQSCGSSPTHSEESHASIGLSDARGRAAAPPNVHQCRRCCCHLCLARCRR